MEIKVSLVGIDGYIWQHRFLLVALEIKGLLWKLK